MFKAKIQKPTKLTKLEMKELKHMDTEEKKEKRKRDIKPTSKLEHFFLNLRREQIIVMNMID